jgi:hypothetical protein
MAVRRFVGLSALLLALLCVPFLFTSLAGGDMQPKMTLLGVALGLAAALGLHQLSFVLRAKWPRLLPSWVDLSELRWER